MNIQNIEYFYLPAEYNFDYIFIWSLWDGDFLSLELVIAIRIIFVFLLISLGSIVLRTYSMFLGRICFWISTHLRIQTLNHFSNLSYLFLFLRLTVCFWLFFLSSLHQMNINNPIFFASLKRSGKILSMYFRLLILVIQ